ncbi:TetR family transcriptional regulator [Mycobacterium antarcticum]|uniref:TetR/AcrR family transcriptional regulator n=1 Tax=unclassified Mycolicibacterium TaxID=2636767 RepID=UPI0023946B76|nr:MULTISPECIES: TetR/AcrR family transcriptional regulator [unclassified Mycolicibacterium]GLP75150.1 TetR family transcriptional regulator [Mycolicibacterium sp. TUM20983]GLP80932.1 TetR family transcriptional regulator [Mycolicibacterium sp. TUM20984]
MAVSSDDVLDAVTVLLSRDASATTGDIARAAGVSRATLGRLFADRDAMVRALLERCVARVVGAIDRALEVHDRGTPLLTALVEEVLPEAQAFVFLAAQPAAYGDDADRIYDRIAQRLELVMRDAQRDGTLRNDLPAAWLADVVQATTLAGAESLRLGRIAARDAPALVIETLQRGIGTQRALPG